jgi:hypothetical protein
MKRIRQSLRPPGPSLSFCRIPTGQPAFVFDLKWTAIPLAQAQTAEPFKLLYLNERSR